MTTKRVLYAEDEFTNRKLLEMKLKNHGISCDLAHDGVQALELFQKYSYNLVILDQYMPGMNGDQVARRIRETHPELPLIAITSDDGEIERLNAAGFNEVFIKPLRGQHYIDSIKNYLT